MICPRAGTLVSVSDGVSVPTPVPKSLTNLYPDPTHPLSGISTMNRMKVRKMVLLGRTRSQGPAGKIGVEAKWFPQEAQKLPSQEKRDWIVTVSSPFKEGLGWLP